MKSSQRFLGAAAFLAAGLALIAWGVNVMFEPLQYRAIARIKVGGTTMDRVEGELDVIRSDAVLDRALEKPALASWVSRTADGRPLDAAAARKRLDEHIKLRCVRGTSVIDIGASSPQPDEAAAIANSVADAHREYRIAQREKRVSESIAPLQNQWDAESKQIAELEQQVHHLRLELGILDHEPPDDGTGSEQLRSYFPIKQKLDQLRRNHSKLGGEIARQLGRKPLAVSIDVVNSAVPPRRPDSGGRALGTSLIVAGALLGGGAGFLLKSRGVKPPA